MINTIGQRQAELALNIGKIFSPQQALRIRLVDELCPKDSLMSEAENRMKEWCKIPSLFIFVNFSILRILKYVFFFLNSFSTSSNQRINETRYS